MANDCCLGQFDITVQFHTSHPTFAFARNEMMLKKKLNSDADESGSAHVSFNYC